MSVENLELETIGRERPEISRLSMGSAGFDRWLAERLWFIRDVKKWHRDSSDLDIYDTNPDTIHLVSSNSSGDIIAGLRLTPQNDVEGSLSWGMLHPDMQSAALADGRVPSSEDHMILDMTRLISGRACVSGQDRMVEIARLFGEGVKLTLEKADKPPVWIFTIDQHFADKMSESGVPIEVVAGGKLSEGDNYDSMFGYVRPIELIQKVSSTAIGHYALGQVGAG